MSIPPASCVCVDRVTLALTRVLLTVAAFAAIITLVFGLLRVAPGGPFDGERRLPPEIEANLRAAYHLDEPVPTQYLRYVAGLLRGDLGPSFRQKDFSVNELVARGVPVSLALGGGALCVALLLGLPLGLVAGMSPGSPLDRGLMAIAGLGVALPAIILGPVGVLVFAVKLDWLPAAGSDSAAHFVLPILTLALPWVTAIARVLRTSTAETLSLPHIRTAYGKGLPTRRIVRSHVLPLALVPVIAFLGPATAGLLTGSVVVEQVFELPGIGRYFVQAALNRDYTLVMGVTVVYASLLLICNLVADLIVLWLDPRATVRGSHRA
jgi:oligopeptide transport system permease protein